MAKEQSKKFNLFIPKGASGSELRDLMFYFVNILGTLDEERDVAEHEVAQQKTVLEKVECLVMQAIENDKDLGKKAALTKKHYLYTYGIVYNGEKTTYTKEAKKLNVLKYKHSRAKSRTKETENLYDAARSGLSYDKIERARV